MDLLFKNLRGSAHKIEKELINFRRHLHRNPETGWKEFETSRSLQEILHLDKISYQKIEGHTGFYTDIRGRENGPLIAYRADMDALPIHDEKEVTYSSQRSGYGHMCGHDVHTTIALGVARLLNKYSRYIKGTVRVLWQPAEELTPGGAQQMIKDCVIENVEAIYAVHCDPTLPGGEFRLKSGAETAAFDTFKITVNAPETTHSARPHTGKDTIWIANQIIQMLYHLPGRISDTRDPAVIAVCTFHGGESFNVIPKKVAFGGSVRTSWEEDRDLYRNHIKKIVHHFQTLHDTHIELDILRGAPSVINNENLFAFTRQTITEQLGPVVRRGRQSMGAEDFAYFTEKVPGLYIRIGTSGSPSTSHPLHSSLFDVDESVIAPVAGLMSYILIQHLERAISSS